MMPFKQTGLALLAAVPMATVSAADLITVKRMSLELANDIAQGAVEHCRETGYQVAAVVVDREGGTQVVLRDTLAPRFTVQIARDKANGVILAKVDSGEFRRNREDIRMEMNHVDDVLVLEGALPVAVAGTIVGAVGVSGAPGGDLDGDCAAAGIAAVQDRLDFAE